MWHTWYLVFLCPAANDSPCIQALLLLPFALLDLHSSSRLFGLVNASVGKQWPKWTPRMSSSKRTLEVHAKYKRQDMEFSSPSPSFSWELMSSTSESRNLDVRKIWGSCNWLLTRWLLDMLTPTYNGTCHHMILTHGTHGTHRTHGPCPHLGFIDESGIRPSTFRGRVWQKCNRSWWNPPSEKVRSGFIFWALWETSF